MAKTVYRKKRNKLAVAMLSPILIGFFIVGWALTFIGRSDQPKAKPPQKPIKNAPAEQGDIEFSVIPYEDEQILSK